MAALPLPPHVAYGMDLSGMDAIDAIARPASSAGSYLRYKSVAYVDQWPGIGFCDNACARLQQCNNSATIT